VDGRRGKERAAKYWNEKFKEGGGTSVIEKLAV